MFTNGRKVEFNRSCPLFLASSGKLRLSDQVQFIASHSLGMEYNGGLYGFSAVKVKLVDSLIWRPFIPGWIRPRTPMTRRFDTCASFLFWTICSLNFRTLIDALSRCKPKVRNSTCPLARDKWIFRRTTKMANIVVRRTTWIAAGSVTRQRSSYFGVRF